MKYTFIKFECCLAPKNSGWLINKVSAITNVNNKSKMAKVTSTGQK